MLCKWLCFNEIKPPFLQDKLCWRSHFAPQLHMFKNRDNGHPYRILPDPKILVLIKNILLLLVIELIATCVCVRACVCVCVCVCVFVFFHREGFFSLQDVWDMLEGYGGSTILCCECYARCFCQVLSSPLLKISYFTSKDENSARQKTGKKTTWYIGNLRKGDIYWYRI